MEIYGLRYATRRLNWSTNSNSIYLWSKSIDFHQQLPLTIEVTCYHVDFIHKNLIHFICMTCLNAIFSISEEKCWQCSTTHWQCSAEHWQCSGTPRPIQNDAPAHTPFRQDVQNCHLGDGCTPAPEPKVAMARTHHILKEMEPKQLPMASFSRRISWGLSSSTSDFAQPQRKNSTTLSSGECGAHRTSALFEINFLEFAYQLVLVQGLVFV